MALLVILGQASGAPVENGLVMTQFPKTAIVRVTMVGRDHYRYNVTDTSWCSGTLVGPNVVLTAAHCIAEAGGDPYTISVAIDDRQWSVQHYFKHPKFDLYSASTSQYPYDLALLMLPASFDTYLPIEVGVDEAAIVGADVKVAGFADSDVISKIGSNRVVAYLNEMLYFEGLRMDRVDSAGYRHADGAQVSADPGDSGGPILSAGGERVLGLSARNYPGMTREILLASFGEKNGGQIADDLDSASKGQNPMILFSGVLLSTPDNIAFLDLAQSQGFDVRRGQAPKPPAPPAPKSKSKMNLLPPKTLGALGALSQQ